MLLGFLLGEGMVELDDVVVLLVVLSAFLVKIPSMKGRLLQKLNVLVGSGL